MKRPSSLANHTVINIFQTGIKPVWEVPEHSTGAAWNIRVNKGHADVLWENLLLGLIGEQFELEDEVTGIVMNVGHSLDKLSVWFRHGNNQEVVGTIRRNLIKILELSSDAKLELGVFFPEAKKETPKPAPSAAPNANSGAQG